MLDFSDLLRTRRSVRRYLDKEVEQEKLDKILGAALMSPASKRSNPWEFIIVEDSSMLRLLSQCRSHSAEFLAEAPLAIVLVADKEKSDVWFEDASIASTIIQLQAHELGLGSCWVQVYLREKEPGYSSEEYVKKMLDVPSSYAVLNMIAIGYAAKELRPYDKTKLQKEKIHREKFIKI